MFRQWSPCIPYFMQSGPIPLLLFSALPNSNTPHLHISRSRRYVSFTSVFSCKAPFYSPKVPKSQSPARIALLRLLGCTRAYSFLLFPIFTGLGSDRSNGMRTMFVSRRKLPSIVYKNTTLYPINICSNTLITQRLYGRMQRPVQPCTLFDSNSYTAMAQ